MSGINLSQSAGESSQRGFSSPERQRKVFRGGSFLMLGVILLILIGWGALYFALASAKNELEKISAEISEKKSRLSSDTVNEIADIQNRLDIIDDISVSLSVPPSILSALEHTVHPNVTFMSFGYDEAERVITIEAEADTYRTFVEQLVAFKAIPGYEKISIERAERTESGTVEFQVGIILVKK